MVINWELLEDIHKITIAYVVFTMCQSLLIILHLKTYLTLQQLYEKGAIIIPF